MSEPEAARPWLAILNPAARGGLAGRRWPALAAALKAHGVRFELAVTHAAGEATALAADGRRRGLDRMLAVGGDGTLYEVLNGLLPGERRATLAVAPLGTGNDWARGRGVPRRSRQVAALLAAPRLLAHDVGVVEFEGAAGRERRYFLNVMGVGYDAYVIEHLSPRGPRAFAYLASLATGLVRYRAPRVRVEADGWSRDARLFVAFAALGRYCGGGMQFAPCALPADGLLDIVTIDHLGALAALARLPRIYSGRVLRDPAVRWRQSARVTFATDVPARVEADGQLLGHTPVTAWILPAAIDVVVP